MPSIITFRFEHMPEHSQESADIRKTNEKYSFEQKEYKAQKIFWIVVIVFLAAGLLGAFGKGALSRVRVEEDEFRIEYERFLRDETSAAFSVFITQGSGSKVVIAIGRDYAERVSIDKVVPQPVSVEAAGERLVYTFNASDGALLIFSITPRRVGAMNLELTVQGQTRHLNQFVFF